MEENHIAEIRKNRKTVEQVKSAQKQDETAKSDYNLKKYRNVVSRIIQ